MVVKSESSLFDKLYNTGDFVKRNYFKIFLCSVVLYLILYLLLIGGDFISFDESYTFAMIKHSFLEIWRITAADVHPPLFYWYLKILTFPFKDRKSVV